MRLLLKMTTTALLLCAAAEATAQLRMVGINGSQAPLTPLVKEAMKVPTVKSTAGLRTDFAPSKSEYFVVAYKGIPTAAVQQQIATVATYVGYVPDYIYLYKAPNALAAVEQIRQTMGEEAGFLEAGKMPWEFKLSKELYELHHHQAALTSEQVEKGLEISVFAPEDLDALRQTLTRWNIAFEERDNGGLRTTVATLKLARQLAAVPYVSFVKLYEELRPEGSPHIRYIIQTNTIDLVNYDRKGPTGKGVYFMNWEAYGKQGYFSVNAYGRTLEGDLGDDRDNGHGTGVGNIAAGANNLGEWGSGGMAPGMTFLSSRRFGTWAIGAQRAQQAGFSPLIVNYSVGYGPGLADYDGESRAIDEEIFRTNTFLNFYSAGNNSKEFHNGYPKRGYGSLTGNFKSSKNNMVVHSSSYPGIEQGWTSFGPTLDGRMKPDISAQGTAGTSFASPGAAGLAGVLMEQYQTTYGTPARTDVTKAVMLNTALRARVIMDLDTRVEDETVNYITYRSGFGEINPLAAVEAIKEKKLHIAEKLNQDEVRDFYVEVPEGQTEARFLLYYNDAPGTAGAVKTLVNDLDLVVIDPTGREFLPWTLDPSKDKVHLPPTRKENRLDNVEQVALIAPTKGELLPAGRYTLRVRAHAIPDAAHSPAYVLTWQYRPRGMKLLTVPEGFRVSIGNELLLAWELNLPEDDNKKAGYRRNLGFTPKVRYRLHEQDEWKPISPKGNNYGANFFLVDVVEEMASKHLQFEIHMGGDLAPVVTNKVEVTRRVVTRPEILALSPKQVTLRWEAPAGVSTGKYYIHALYDKYMTVIDSIDFPTTTKVVAAPEHVTFGGRTWFAVSYKNGDTGAMSQRTLANSIDQSSDESGEGSYRWRHLTHTLCADDEVFLSAVPTQGKIQWHKYFDTTPLPLPADEGGTDRDRRFRVADAGRYYYTLTPTDTDEAIYTSPTVTINAPDLQPSRKLYYGIGHWAGYAFFDKDANNSQPLRDKENLPYYGYFKLHKMGFNSTDDLFPWREKNLFKIPGYVGCQLPGNSTQYLFIFRRRSFRPGTYTFQIRRSAWRSRIIFRNRAGEIIREQDSRHNGGDEEPITIYLDESHTCEIQWAGEHFMIDITEPPYDKSKFSDRNFESNALYRIKSALPSFFEKQNVEKSIRLDYATNRPVWGTHNATDVSELFQLTKLGNWQTVRGASELRLNLSAANVDVQQPTKQYLTHPANELVAQPIPLRTTDLGDKQFKFRTGTAFYYHAGGHDNGDGKQGHLMVYDANTNSASAWYFEKVTHLPFYISEVGYATAFYPFSIKAPEIDGLTLYIPQIREGETTLRLAKVAPGTIVHKHTPLILEGYPGFYAAEIAYEAFDIEHPADPFVKGVTVPHSIPANSYVMAYNEEKGIGFYPIRHRDGMSVTQLGANRVYLTLPTTMAAPEFISWDNAKVVNGITSLETSTASGASYLLNGKQAPSAFKGIYITADGKKVYRME